MNSEPSTTTSEPYGDGEAFPCDCGRPIPWPTRAEDRGCPDCGTVWEHDGIDLGAGARIKSSPLITGPDDEDDEDDELVAVVDDDEVPYCTVCGGRVGIFQGHDDGWHHWAGSGTAADPIVVTDPGHHPIVAWRRAGAL